MAANLIIENRELAKDELLVDKIAEALIKSHIFDKVGELYELTGHSELALENYTKGNEFAKAVDVSVLYN
jgi:intraflagellar transport protein 172